MRDGPLVIVGDVFLDRDVDGTVERLAPDAPVPVLTDPMERGRAGGAGMAAALAASGGRPVTLVTALADDGPANELRELLARAGVTVVDLGLDGTTEEKIRLRCSGRPLLRLDRGGPSGRLGPLTDDARAAITSAAGVLVSDYGRGIAAAPGLRDLIGRLPPRTPIVWDPHPRGAEPVPGVRLATPNDAEARLFAGQVDDGGLAAVAARGRILARRWSAAGVATTLGAGGALLVEGDGAPLAVPATRSMGSDPCGAGDRFASTAALALVAGALPSEAVTVAVAAATAFVAAGGASAFPAAASAAGPSRTTDEADDVIARVRGAGGTVVFTGGCFDLLHAGHVSLLHNARALGDCLIVCLNADASVRRLKGPDRPVNSQADRASVLRALDSVDAVVVFDDDTPEALLEQLRPDIWVKGADYSVSHLPEARLLRSWGGTAMVLPYLEGRSTTRLLQEVSARARH